MRHAGLLLLLLVSACGVNVEPSSTEDSSEGIAYDPAFDYSGAAERGARIIFHRNHFTNLDDFATFQQTRFLCPGDVTQVFQVTGGDYNGSPTVFDVASGSDTLQPTYKPDFLKNVSVDITNTFYSTTQAGVVQTDACSYRQANFVTSSCADFDWDTASAIPDPAPTITPTPTPNPTPDPVATPVPPAYLPLHGYYRVRDPWCTGQGVITSSDPEATKSHIGGVNIDLNRSRMGSHEDLLLVMTYQAFREGASWPYDSTNPGEVMEKNDETWFQVNLIGTSLGFDALLGLPQPRAWQDYQNPSVPVYYKTLATFRDSYAGLRSEQLVIPLSQNGMIDRIRIERVRGSFHLYQLDLYRLGHRE